MAEGTYGPIKIWGDTSITSIKIFGGFMGYSWEIHPAVRQATGTYETIIDGDLNGALQPAVWLECDFTGGVVLDGLTLKGRGPKESVALRIVYTVNTIVNRCLFEGSTGGGNLIFLEGRADGQNHTAFTNCIIKDNDVYTIIEAYYGFKFINCNILDNSNTRFLYTAFDIPTDVFEIKNSIVSNTSHVVVSDGSYYPNYNELDVYNSIVDNFTHFTNKGNNHPGVYLADNGPYDVTPNNYTVNGGNNNFISPYQSITDPYDYRGTSGLRFFKGTTVDIGAFESSLMTPPAAAPQQKTRSIEGIDLEIERSVKIYPTSLNSGEILYIENSFDASLTAKIYNMSGVELYSASISSSEEQVNVTMPHGVYMVIITDDTTGQRVCTEKIMIK